jgi:predicted transcriptional regulator
MAYDKLEQSEIKQIEKRIILQRRVAEFVKDCNIPYSAYYNALYGKRIKSEQKEIILLKLQMYA